MSNTVYAVMEQQDNQTHIVELFQHKITAEVLLRELQAETFDAEWECNSVGFTNHYIREFDINTALLGA